MSKSTQHPPALHIPICSNFELGQDWDEECGDRRQEIVFIGQKIAGSGLDEMGELGESEATLQPCETAWDLGSALKMVTFKAYRLPE